MGGRRVENRQEGFLEEAAVSAHHGGQDGQEERSGGHITGAFGEDRNQQTEDDRCGCRRYALQRGQFVSQPLRQT